MPNGPLKRLTLSQLKEILNMSDEQSANDYIAQNMAIARNPAISELLTHLSAGPFLLPDMRIMVCTRGSSDPVVNLQPMHIEAGEIVFISAGSIVQVTTFDEQLQGFGISITDDLLALALGSHMPHLFDGHLRDCHFRLAPEETEQIRQLHTLLYNTIGQPDHSSQVVLHLISAFLWEADNFCCKYEAANLLTQTRQQRLLADFLGLVNKHSARERSIEFYADRLCISPRYMSTLIKQASGRGAKDWIDEAITQRIKIELRHTTKTIAQISDELNFPNSSFFCKFFKRITGTTPQAGSVDN